MTGRFFITTSPGLAKKPRAVVRGENSITIFDHIGEIVDRSGKLTTGSSRFAVAIYFDLFHQCTPRNLLPPTEERRFDAITTQRGAT